MAALVGCMSDLAGARIIAPSDSVLIGWAAVVSCLTSLAMQACALNR